MLEKIAMYLIIGMIVAGIELSRTSKEVYNEASEEEKKLVPIVAVMFGVLAIVPFWPMWLVIVLVKWLR